MTGTPLKILCAAGALVFLTTTPAYAYLDGGTVTMIVQVIVGSIAGIGAYVGLRFYSVRAYFRRIFGREDLEKEASRAYSSAKEE